MGVDSAQKDGFVLMTRSDFRSRCMGHKLPDSFQRLRKEGWDRRKELWVMKARMCGSWNGKS